MTTEQPNDTALDPNRPFARMMRGDHEIIIEADEEAQWVADWLAYSGLTAEELLDRRARRDFDGWWDRMVWLNIGPALMEGRYGQDGTPDAA